MPTATLDTPNPTADVPACHALHVKAVPYEVWCRARHNANLSRMTLRDYVIRLLAEAHPYPIHTHHVDTPHNPVGAAPPISNQS